MMSFGFVEMLLLAIMSGGTSNTDVIALVQPKHYFQYRDWEPSIDKMVDIAFEEPKTAKAQIAQLTCLRYLADESEALKKSPKYADQRRMIEAIAQAKRAQDPEGFAKEYANRVLMKLDNAKPAALRQQPLRAEALNWFPADVSLAGAVDQAQSRQANGGPDVIKQVLKMLPERDRKQMYSFIEKVGNVRLERLSFAFSNSAQGDQKIYIRATGKANHTWISDTIKEMDGVNGGLAFKTSKDEKGTPITIISDPNKRNPSLLLVGNTDFLVVGHKNGGRDQDALVAEVLAVRDKKKPAATTGPLKERLGKVPEQALAFLIGDVPDEMKRGLAFTFNPVPSNITAYIERAQQGMDLHAETSMPNAEDGAKLIQKIAMLRKEGIKSIQDEMQQPRRPGEPPIPFQALINLMESLQVQGKDEKVQVRAFAPDGLIQQLTEGWMMLAAPRQPLPPPCGE